MLPFQAHESVVFQIMQLVSAPFLAMATWYRFSPSMPASATVLAFGTGFASEYLLMAIRGMVEGLRPESSRPLAAPGVTLRGAEMRTVMAEADGSFAFNNVGPGTPTLVVGLAGAPSVSVTVGDSTPPVVEIAVP